MPQNPNNPPRHLQGGPSFTMSDRGGGGANTRKRPADIDEIIHFVRRQGITQGLTRETTEMRLTRNKAPLPGIGQHMVNVHPLQPPVSIPGGGGGNFGNSHSHSHSQSYQMNNRKNNHNHHRKNQNVVGNSVDTDGTDEAYELDTDTLNIMDYSNSMDTHRSMGGGSPTFPSSNQFLSASQSNILLGKSLESQGFSTLSPIKTNKNNNSFMNKSQGQGKRGSRKGVRLDPSPTRGGPQRAGVRALPPMLQHERPLHRPTAPSPSVTPPLSRSGDEEDDDFIET